MLVSIIFMAHFRKLFFLLLLISFTSWAHLFGNEAADSIPNNEIRDNNTEIVKEETITLTITINSLSKVEMKNVPAKGYLEVYNILGKREKRIKLDDSEGEISVDLPKGLYILKAEKVTQKIVVK